jgi:transcriptional regulator with XRE-family HTH domain
VVFVILEKRSNYLVRYAFITVNVNTFLGKKLRELRAEQSLYEVGKAAGVSRGNLKSYEDGLHLPTEEVLKRLAMYFACPYKELRVYYYADYYARFPEERSIVLEWANRIRKGENL